MHQQHKLYTYTNPSSMEKAPQSTFCHSLSLTEHIVFLFYNTIFIWLTILNKFSARFLSLLLPHHHEELHACAASRSHHAEKNPPSNRGDDLALLGGDVEIILDKMGIRSELNGERFEEKLRFDELSTMFEEKEPSLEEVKQAFAVFDENSDGFIDAVELMRVLSKLGFKDGVKLDECERMIASYDENKDGRIDFNEFIKFMESSFC
uniref:EF-hand domain-containing protein n=1 Tax=Ananas comosus var. bracteatus TaxID=296719 RepID=A0A6V7P719_ANACO|nr:unnamed protein product [Ananas comosus var. bracteatus]